MEIVELDELPIDRELRLKEIKKRILILEDETKDINEEYVQLAEQLKFEEECRKILVDKYTEIRVRRMEMYNNPPKNGKMFFIEEKRHEVMRKNPTVTTWKGINELLENEWEKVDQEQWNNKFKSLQAKLEPPKKKTSKTTGTAGRKGSIGTSTTVSKTKRKAASTNIKTPKKRKPATEKKGSPTTTKLPSKAKTPKKSAGGTKENSFKSPPASASTTTANKNSKPPTPVKAKKKLFSLKKTNPLNRKSNAINKKNKSSSSITNSSIVPAVASGGEVVDNVDDDEDDDDDDDDDEDEDDDDDDNESASSIGGSASDDDSDDHMAHLPTGAFG